MVDLTCYNQLGLYMLQFKERFSIDFPLSWVVLLMDLNRRCLFVSLLKFVLWGGLQAKILPTLFIILIPNQHNKKLVFPHGCHFFLPTID